MPKGISLANMKGMTVSQRYEYFMAHSNCSERDARLVANYPERMYTKKGNMRDPAVVAAAILKESERQKENQRSIAREREQKKKDRKKRHEISRNDERLGMLEEEYLEMQRAIQRENNPLLKQRSKKGKSKDTYTKEEKAAYRKARDAAKLRAKNAKKKRREARKNVVEVESGEMPSSDNGAGIFGYPFVRKWVGSLVSEGLMRGADKIQLLEGREFYISSLIYMIQMFMSKSIIEDIALTTQYNLMARVTMHNISLASQLDSALEMIKKARYTVDDMCHYFDGASFPVEVVKNRGGYAFVDSRNRGFGCFHNDLKSDISDDESDDELQSDDRSLRRSRGDVKKLPDVSVEALSDVMFQVANNMEAVISSHVIVAVRDIVLSAISAQIFDKDFARSMTRYIGKPSHMTLPEAAILVTKSLGIVLKAYEMYKEGHPFSTIFFSPDPYTKAVVRAKELVLLEPLLFYGLPRPQRVCAKAFVVEAEEVIKVLDSLSSKMNPFSEKRINATKLSLELRSVFNRVRERICFKKRRTPFGSVIHGQPGVGKSSVVRLNTQFMSYVMEREHLDSLTFSRNPDSEYWDGLRNYEQPYFHYSEIGNWATSIVERVGDPVVKELCSVIDSNPYNLNMAAIDGKGVTACIPELVVIDTNFADLNAGKTVRNPAAVYRRMVFTEVRVRPQCTIEGSHMLDPKRGNDEFAPHDKWLYTVYKLMPTASGCKDYSKRVLLTDGGFDEYSRTMIDLMRKHFEKEELALEAAERNPCLDPDFLKPRVQANKFFFDSFPIDIPRNLEFEGDHPLTLDHFDVDALSDFIVDDFKGYLYSDTISVLVSSKSYVEKWDELALLGIVRSQAIVESGDLFESVSDLAHSSMSNLVLNVSEFGIKVTEHIVGVGIDVLLVLKELLVLGMALFACLPNGVKMKTYIISFFLSIYFGLFSLLAMCVTLACYDMGVSGIAKLTFGRIFDRAKGNVSARVNSLRSRSYRTWCYVAGRACPEMFVTAKLIAVTAATATSLYILHKLVERWNRVKPAAEASTFEHDEKVSAELNEFETCYHLGKSYERSEGNNRNWVTRSVAPSVHTGDPKSLADSVGRNIRFCKIRQDDTKSVTTYLFGLKQDYALIHHHAFCGDHLNRVQMLVSGDPATGGYREFSVDVDNAVFVTNDLMLVRTTGINFADKTKHFPLEVVDFKYASGFIGDHTTYVSSSVPLEVVDKKKNVLKYQNVITYKWPKHRSGSCGLPVVAQRDSGCCIVGIHSAGANNSDDAYGIVVTQDMIAAAIIAYEQRYGENNICCEASLPFGDVPHKKSPVFFENLETLEFLGSEPVTSVSSASRLKPSIFAKSQDEAFERIFNFVETQYYGRPLMKPRMSKGEWLSPYNNALKKMAKPKKSLNIDRLNKSVDYLIKVFGERLEKLQLEGKIPEKIQPLDVETAINGVDYDAYLRRINVHTAAGHGKPGKKSKYCHTVPSNVCRKAEIKEEIKKEVLEILRAYERGECSGVVFKAALKDEPRPAEKIKLGKTRVFYVSPFAFLIVQRMLLAPFYTLMVQFAEIFCTALGVDMHRQAPELFERIVNFALNILEGDFGGYDVSMPVEIGEGANRIIIALLQKLGYTDDQIKLVRGVLSDCLFVIIEMIGDRFLIPGLQPSGKYATAEDNSLRNLIIHVYVWFSIPEVCDLDFFTYVLPTTYGDDVLDAVKNDVAAFYNSLTFAKVVEEEIGLEFTTSSKGEVLASFISVEDMTFLKRTFKRHFYLGTIVAPLDMESIHKMLKWTLPSTEVNPETQMEQTVASAVREAFFHCESIEQFDEFRSYLIDVLVEEYKHEFDIPTFYQIADSLCPTEDLSGRGGRRTPERDNPVEVESGLLLECSQAERFCQHLRAFKEDLIPTECCLGRQCNVFKWPQKINIYSYINALKEEQKEVQYELRELPLPSTRLPWPIVVKSAKIRKHGESYDALRSYNKLKSKDEAISLTVSRLERYLINRDIHDIEVESGVIADDNSITTADDFENVVDVGGLSSVHYHTGEEKDLDTGSVNLLRMDNFFERPITLATITGTVGSQVNYVVDLWDAITLNPTVRAKLRNYAYLKADVEVRIAVSGTPFHYGMLLVSYQPLADNNSALNTIYGLIGTHRFQALSYLSQAPGACVINVRENQPVNLTCKYVNVQPMIRLFNKSPLIIPDTGSFNDTVGLGKLYINSINNIECASSTPTNVSIYVYARLVNVELGTGTGTVVQVTTESGEMDERKVGPIEKFATRASAVSTAIASFVPEIEPFAVASSLIFGSIGKVASLFGFSAPTMNNEPVRVRNDPFENGAHTIGYHLDKRLTLDPKQELTIDPRVCGTDEDDMVIANLCARETLLDTFAWDVADAPLASSIWMAPVNPAIVKRDVYAVGPVYIATPTALSFAATPFEWWRGTIDFRFQIVASQFHRGKLAVIFEPNISQNVVIDTDLDLNKQFIKIIDIQETQDVTFSVEWAFPKAWARVLTSDLLGDLGTVGFLGDALFDYANGYIAVVPFTALQSPDGSDVSVNVYISSQDMRFNYVTDRNLPTTRPVVESGEMTTSGTARMNLNDSTATLDHICELHFGEAPLSFRALLKRFVAAYNRQVPSSFSSEYLYYKDDALPAIYPDFSGSSGPINLFSYLRYAYLGVRGGVRHRISIDNIDLYALEKLRVSNLSCDSVPTVRTYSTTTVDTVINSRLNGTVAYMPDTNGGVQFEIPFYTNNLFGISFSKDIFPSSNTNVDAFAMRGFRLAVHNRLTSASEVNMIHDVAAGEDFSFMRFQGAPCFTFT
ncbi:hypothetical protein [Beihai picorna-like virus 61]|uniref:hypothetical protein n=1 Tax=Beihai picorna-like virus 61 TaxID=1922607 RepID=UPI00090B9417|nr:hypothetical protein [Beihai picorna-like virus 61]APG76696.1 hypothetical protein [Beihai picorna-like virus 61]